MDGYFDANVELFKHKAVFCYDYAESFARLVTLALLPQEAVYNKLKGVKCSQTDYARSQHG